MYVTVRRAGIVLTSFLAPVQKEFFDEENNGCVKKAWATWPLWKTTRRREKDRTGKALTPLLRGTGNMQMLVLSLYLKLGMQVNLASDRLLPVQCHQRRHILGKKW